MTNAIKSRHVLFKAHKKSKDCFKLKGPSSFVSKVDIAEFLHLKQQVNKHLKEVQKQADEVKKMTKEIRN